ncbi:hypothetical protein Ancab_031279 [Ancistrocladus abbreviatus]
MNRKGVGGRCGKLHPIKGKIYKLHPLKGKITLTAPSCLRRLYLAGYLPNRSSALPVCCVQRREKEMHCDGLVSGSASRFPLSSKRALLALKGSIPDSSSSRFSFTTRLANPSFSIKTRFESLKTRATVNDGFVKPVSEMTFYELLGIPENVTLSEIKQAYKQLARKYHPDVSPQDQIEENTQKFIRVQEAYETLSDPNRRALYDVDMARGVHFAFSTRKFCNYDEVMEVRSEWKNRWQNQLSGLKRRSMRKESEENLSWAARLRRQREAGEDLFWQILPSSRHLYTLKTTRERESFCVSQYSTGGVRTVAARMLEPPFVPREKLIEKQKYFQSIHKPTYLKGPYDKITSVAVPIALAASSIYLIARGIYNMSHGIGKKE